MGVRAYVIQIKEGLAKSTNCLWHISHREASKPQETSHHSMLELRCYSECCCYSSFTVLRALIWFRESIFNLKADVKVLSTNKSYRCFIHIRNYLLITMNALTQYHQQTSSASIQLCDTQFNPRREFHQCGKSGGWGDLYGVFLISPQKSLRAESSWVFQGGFWCCYI